MDDNLYALIINGHPSIEELRSTWASILADYTDRLGTEEYKLYASCYKEITLLELTISQIEILAGGGKDKNGQPVPGLLSKCYSAELCEELNKLLRTQIVFNPEDQPSYQEALMKCQRRTWSIRVRLDLKRTQFEAIKKKQEGGAGQATGRDYFISVLIKLSDHARYPIQDSVTVFEYCERIIQLNKFVASQNTQNRKRR